MKQKKIAVSVSLFLVAGMFILLSELIPQESAKELFEKALYFEETRGDLEEAIALYERVAEGFPDDRAIAAKALFHMGVCYEKLGLEKAKNAFQKIVEDYPDQAEMAGMARAKLAILVQPRAISPKEEEGLKIQHVWTDQNAGILGAVSPDGRYMTFTDWNTGDLAVRDLATKKDRRLTDKGSWMKSPAHALFSIWSPDGKHIVYNWYNPEGKSYDLHLVSLENPEPSVLFKCKEYEYGHPFDWHGNGQQVLVGFMEMRTSATSAIGYLSVSDGNLQILKSFDSDLAQDGPWSFVISPDGRTIAYDNLVGQDSNNRDIFLLSADGTEERLVDHPALDYVFDWTSDGRYLLFGSERTGVRGVWIIQVKNGKAVGSPYLVKPNSGPVYPIGCTKENKFYYGYSKQIYDVYVTEIDADTGQVLHTPKKEIRHYEGNNANPDYSPDGKYLAYISYRSNLPMGKNAICIYNLENGSIQELYPEFGNLSYPQWHPDGETISLEGTDKEGRKGIYLFEVKTGKVSPLVQIDKNEDIYAHRWSVDGKTLYYTKGLFFKDRTFRIFSHDVTTGKDQELPGSPDDAQDFDVSPDGESIVFLNRDMGTRSLRIIPAEGGEPRELYSFQTEGTFVITPAWSRNGKFIYFPQPAESVDNTEKKSAGVPDNWDLWRISVEDGEAQKLDVKMATIRHTSVHPDGRFIAFSSSGRSVLYPEIWVMENFLPKEDSKE
jgi:Tol biopolymer transport system component